MIRALLAKELRQHGFALVFLLLLPFAGLILIANHGLLRQAGGGGFESVHLMHYTFVPLACLVLGQLLIAQEFRQKTQLFLEGLPLPRWRMLAVKFGLGLGLVALTSATALIFVWGKARGTEAMTPRFATLLAGKSSGWAGFLYTLCFAHAFLGRYRVPFGVALVAGLAYCSSLDLPISQFGPFALIDDRFAFERFVWPVLALAVTGGLILLFTSLGFYLGLVRDATVAALLAEKMSSREKLFLTFLSLILILVGGEISEHRKTATPVQMPGASEVDRSVVRILASAAVDAPTRQEAVVLQHTVDSEGAELDAVTGYLGCVSYPPVFIVHRRDLAVNEFSNGDLKAVQGVLVRTNLIKPGFQLDALSAWLLHETLLAHTSGLAGRERNAWILDGFEWWWPRSKHGEISAWAEAVGTKGVVGTLDFSAKRMHRWLTVRKEIGADQARMLAGSVLALLAERHGVASVRRFLADRFGPAQPVDARGWWRDVVTPNSMRLQAASGLSEEDLAAEWRHAFVSAPCFACSWLRNCGLCVPARSASSGSFSLGWSLPWPRRRPIRSDSKPRRG